MKSSRTGSKPPAFPDADPALRGGVSGRHPRAQHRSCSRGGGEDGEQGGRQKWCLLPQSRSEEGGFCQPAGERGEGYLTVRTAAAARKCRQCREESGEENISV